MRHMTVRGTPRASSAAAGESLTLADGTRISFRPLNAQDRCQLAGLFARLTPDSRYQRFHSPKRELTVRELTYFTDVDHLNHEAIAAVDQRDNSIIGVARYVRDAGRAEAADMAIEVADTFHNMGIGTALTSCTIRQAQANGLTFLTAMTRWDNRAARRLLGHHGFRARHSRGGEIEYELKLSDRKMHPHDVRHRRIRPSDEQPHPGALAIERAIFH
jgi:ribosomal protein S18 acetylase RimI-like enzyme